MVVLFRSDFLLRHQGSLILNDATSVCLRLPLPPQRTVTATQLEPDSCSSSRRPFISLFDSFSPSHIFFLYVRPVGPAIDERLPGLSGVTSEQPRRRDPLLKTD